jgi:hypothetical protein
VVCGGEDGGQGLERVEDHAGLAGGFGCLHAGAQQLLGAEENCFASSGDMKLLATATIDP